MSRFFYIFSLSFLLISISCTIEKIIYLEKSETPDTNPDINNNDDGSPERINGINYLADEEQIEIVCNYSYNGDPSGLIISEVTQDWIEIFNTRNVGTNPLCLGRYKLRTSTSNDYETVNRYYNLPDYSIEPQTYVVIRFLGDAINNSSDVIIINGPGLKLTNSRYVGFYELTHTNGGGEPETVDYLGFCRDGINLPVSPVSGSFTGCVNYSQGNYLSFSRSQSLTDTDSAEDWSSFTDTDSAKDWSSFIVPTFGGPNDVLIDTDNDNDGIPDANEMMGTTYAGMPLYDWGARPNQRDIFVYISYMEGSDIKKGLIPPKESLDKIKKIFSENGFAVHFDVGNLYSSNIGNDDYNISGNSHEVLYSTHVSIENTVVVFEEVPEPVSVIYYKNRYMPINRFGLFHHVLFANRSADSKYSLGVAELPGNDLILFIGGEKSIDSLSEQSAINFTAALLFHELGHNFNLRHGGFESENYKPNHFSTMNYGYIHSGVPLTNKPSWFNFYNRYLLEFQQITSNVPLLYPLSSSNFIINYSYGQMPDINELSVSEIEPLGPDLGNIDWNVDAEINTNEYVLNLNPRYSSSSESIFRTLKDYNEWGNLQLPFDYEQNIGYNDFRIFSQLNISSRFRYLSQEGDSEIIQCDFHGFHFK